MPNPNLKIFSPDDAKQGRSAGERLLNETISQGRNLCNYGAVAPPSAYQVGAQGRERANDGTFTPQIDEDG